MSNDKLTPEETYILFLEINRILLLEFFAEMSQKDSSKLGIEVAMKAAKLVKQNSLVDKRKLLDEMKPSFMKLVYPYTVDRSYSSSNNSD